MKKPQTPKEALCAYIAQLTPAQVAKVIQHLPFLEHVAGVSA